MENGLIRTGSDEDKGIGNPLCTVEDEKNESTGSGDIAINQSSVKSVVDKGDESTGREDVAVNQNGVVHRSDVVDKKDESTGREDLAVNQNGGVHRSNPKYEPVEYHNDVDETTCSIKIANEESSYASSEKELTPVGGSTLSFHDIHYTVQVKAGRCCRKANKPILKGMRPDPSFHRTLSFITPGLNAIMGPTGGGKTTLLDILAARNNPRGLSGKVLMDGKPLPSDFRLISGYVVQEDIVMGTLTVRENLAFSAALRLSSSISETEKADRVEDVIAELGLQSCADTKIGNQFIKGVSGGERKRTSVGLELLIQPNILFMDEPTTGLDASTAGSLMMQLSRLSEKGRTIIISIHQPRYKIYRLFNRLHLLASGETVYHGEAKHALQFFVNNGYVHEENDNPADFILDCIIENQRAYYNSTNGLTKNVHETTGSRLCNHDSQTNNQDAINMDSRGKQPSLSECFQNSDHYSNMKTEVDTLYEKFKLEDDVVWQKITYNTSFLTQMNFIGRRAFLNYIRSPQLCIKQIFVVCVFGLFIGMLYFQLGGAPENAIQDRTGAIFFIGMHIVFMNLNAVDAFIAERIIFFHESSSGYYRTSAYFLSKLICDMVPQRTIPVVMYGTITYWMIGLRPDTSSFLMFMLNLNLSAYCWTGAFILLGSFAPSLVEAMPILGLSIIVALMFSGFLLNINSILMGLSWIKYISPIRYSLNFLFANELSGSEFCAEFPYNSTCAYGDVYLDEQDIDHTTWGIWLNQIVLAGFTLLFFSLSYIKLRTMPRYK